MAKNVALWAVTENNPHMWGYFVLAALQWLPTKSRKLKNQQKDTVCRLCLQGEQDDLHHITCCPALQRHHDEIKVSFLRIIASWKILPMERTVLSDKLSTCSRWVGSFLSRQGTGNPAPTRRILMSLAEGFYENTNGRTRSGRLFQAAVYRTINRVRCSCSSSMQHIRKIL